MANVNLLGYHISNSGLSADVSRAWKCLQAKHKNHYLACANPHSLVLANQDRVFRDALTKADILIPDGSGIILAAKLLNLPIFEKVAGYDFFISLTESAKERCTLRYFFLGSTDSVLQKIVSRLNSEYPHIIVSGVYSPPFKNEFTPEDNRKIIDTINASNSDVLWVGMTAPKQEKWLYNNIDHLKVSFAAAVGAVFDFYALTRKRSSLFWQKSGLEWFPRLLKEPKKLWKRTFISGPIFLSWILAEKIKLFRKYD